MMKQVLLLVSCLVVKGLAECADMCPFNYNPVCGSDGQTYSNECSLKVHACQLGGNKLTLAYPGECQEVTNRDQPAAESRQAECSTYRPGCPRIYKPVCGTDSRTYSNECVLCQEIHEGHTRSDTRISHDGEC